jgi:hypothetical protein
MPRLNRSFIAMSSTHERRAFCDVPHADFHSSVDMTSNEASR